MSRPKEVRIPVKKIADTIVYGETVGAAMSRTAIKKVVKKAIERQLGKSFLPATGIITGVAASVGALCLVSGKEDIVIELEYREREIEYLGPGGTHSVTVKEVDDFDVYMD